VIERAVLYLSRPEDAVAALLPVANRPVAFRALMTAVRAGVRHVDVPTMFRGTDLERAIEASPAARTAVVWLDGDRPAPNEPILLMPAAAIASRSAVAAMLARAATAILAESGNGDAPIVVASPSLVRSLWKEIAAGGTVGAALRRDIEAGEARVAPGSGYRRVLTAETARQADALVYATLGTSIDTRLDTLVHRRLSRPLSRLAVAWGVTPNHVSVASLMVGLGAAWCFGRGAPGSAVIGFVLFVVAVVLDHVDGEVARITLTETTFGEWLDVAADTFVHAALVVAMGVAAQRAAGGGGAVFGVVAAVGIVISATLAKTWPTSAGGIGGLFQGLSNRDGFYAVLAAFVLALTLAPALLPLLMIVVAAGSHAYWLGRVAYGYRPLPTRGASRLR